MVKKPQAGGPRPSLATGMYISLLLFGDAKIALVSDFCKFLRGKNHRSQYHSFIRAAY